MNENILVYVDPDMDCRVLRTCQFAANDETIHMCLSAVDELIKPIGKQEENKNIVVFRRRSSKERTRRNKASFSLRTKETAGCSCVTLGRFCGLFLHSFTGVVQVRVFVTYRLKSLKSEQK